MIKVLENKTVLVGVTGSIAAYKAASLVSMLVKSGADVHVLMTQNARKFINEITFETLTGNKCLFDTFDRNFEFKATHVSIAQKADLFIIAPATANVIAKVANGIADDMLTTTFLAAKCPKVISPAMNTAMFENPVTQDNMEKCRHYGYEIIEPASGYLACGDTGKGKMPEPEYLFECILNTIQFEKDLEGKKVLVTAGPTMESIDPVRFITNHSSGKMGYSIAKVAACRGAKVTLVSGPVNLKAPVGVEVVNVKSAAQMFEAVKEKFAGADIIIKSAAVADYRPKNVSDEKVKKQDGELSIELERTDDLLAWIGKNRKSEQVVCGFSMETQNMLENSRAKLAKKNIDVICANNLKVEGAGFGIDTNVVTIITKEKEIELPVLSKEEVAVRILDFIIEMKK
ncbi:MAG: bifunctional phosphopantothenoylcysteine decarboxylase/phosphopantothenate--cysteine ligase CoaBC [Spirochaetales bacterium]|nr:bifunctional phosphopantothenoylcysteine decarboxylase/phosphopantothenate--cysteine ligase CoaBC [Spirochaetales bacterium]